MKRGKRLSRTVMVMPVVLASLLIGASACTKVEPGYVGIKVNNWGSQRGVQDYPLKTGMVLYNPLTEDMYDFPTFMVTRTWTQDVHEGNPTDESITFNSIEGTQVNADVAITYFFDAHKVPDIFVKFRAKPDVLTDGYIHNRVRDYLNREASDMKVVDIFGQGKQKILYLPEAHTDFMRDNMFDVAALDETQKRLLAIADQYDTCARSS